MATPLTAAEGLNAFRREGLTVVQLGGWATHNRNHVGAWGEVEGVMIHHTGSDLDPRAAEAYASGLLEQGYASLPGPLCHAGLSPVGTVYLTGWGRCNHAGGGDSNVLNAIRTKTPLSRPRVGNSGGADGNRAFYGLEVMYSGSSPMAKAQRAAAVRWAAALCRAHNWGAHRVIGHGEWSADKWDPGKEPMDDFRRDVAELLALPAGSTTDASPTSTTPPTPAQTVTTIDEEEDLMRLITSTPRADSPAAARGVTLITARGATAVSSSELRSVQRYLQELRGEAGSAGVLLDAEVSIVRGVLARVR